MRHRIGTVVSTVILLIAAPLTAQMVILPVQPSATTSVTIPDEVISAVAAGEDAERDPAAPAPLTPEETFTAPTMGELYSQLQAPRPLLPAAPLRPALPTLPQANASPFARSLAAGSQSRFLSSRSLDRTPFMIGDTSAGSCGSIDFLPGIGVSFEHPIFSCSRLNVSENNSPLPRDRVYFRYNHFHNLTKIAIFPTLISNGSSTLHSEKFTFGAEKTFLEGNASIEVRIPFAYELNSEVLIQDIQGVDNLPVDDLNMEFGNVSFLTKYMIHESDHAALSFGLALNTPTADDVSGRVFIDDDQAEISLPPGNIVRVFDVTSDFTGTISNETFNLSPFVGGIWTPAPRWFTQGFLQFDIPLNPSEGTVGGSGSVNGNVLDLATLRGDLEQQVLMRASVGGGHWLYENPRARHLTGIAGLLELHYTTTLEDAKLQRASAPLVFDALQPAVPVELTIGNLANRVDLLNLTIGGVFQFWNRTSVSHGFVLPLRSVGMDKPFDFEYQLQLNHLF